MEGKRMAVSERMAGVGGRRADGGNRKGRTKEEEQRMSGSGETNGWRGGK